MKKFLRKNNGITLIALVITIIVLLILAGVAIASLTGDNGLLNRATQARNGTILAETKEKIRLSAMDSYVEGNGSITYSSLINSLNRHFKGNGTEEDYYEIVEGDNTTSIWKVRVHTSVGDVDEIINGKVAPTNSYQWKVVADNDNSGTISIGDEVAPLIDAVKNEHFYVVYNNGAFAELITKLPVDYVTNSQSSSASEVTYDMAYCDLEGVEHDWIMPASAVKAVEYSYDEFGNIVPDSEYYVYYDGTETGKVHCTGTYTKNYGLRLKEAGLNLMDYNNSGCSFIGLPSSKFWQIDSSDFNNFHLFSEFNDREFWFDYTEHNNGKVEYVKFRGVDSSLVGDKWWSYFKLCPVIQVDIDLININN